MAKAQGKKLTWHQIVKRFGQEWVELIGYDWPDTEAHPRAGIVRVHAKTRRQFDKLILRDPPKDSALVFVGSRKRRPGIVFSANLRRVEVVDARI